MSYLFSNSQADAIALLRRWKSAGSTRFLTEEQTGDAQEEQEFHLRCLQEWICELLTKNQQLRMELLELKTRRPAYEDDYYA
jgi:hypothetical protein